jgi:hypothetical protein
MFLRILLSSASICLVLFGSGCASKDQVLYDDVEGAKALLENILQPGLSIADARDFIRREFPEPAFDTESAPIVAGMGGPFEFKRYQMMWPTLIPGENIVLTMYFDREGELIRWVIGKLQSDR